jgi:hypothetical protein
VSLLGPIESTKETKMGTIPPNVSIRASTPSPDRKTAAIKSKNEKFQAASEGAMEANRLALPNLGRDL